MPFRLPGSDLDPTDPLACQHATIPLERTRGFASGEASWTDPALQRHRGARFGGPTAARSAVRAEHRHREEALDTSEMIRPVSRKGARAADWDGAWDTTALGPQRGVR